MRVRFFITIFTVLVLTAISISAIHFHFFKQERLRLIELNLEQNATLILDSDLTLTKKEFKQKGEEFIQSIIGDDKVNIIVAIYNSQGNRLYANDLALIFKTPEVLSTFQKWEDVESKEYFVKYLTTEDPVQQRIIRVGMVLNHSLLRWKYLSRRVFIFAAILLVVVLLLSYFLTTLLMRPVKILATQVQYMAHKLETGETENFGSILKTTSDRFPDEFSNLTQSFQVLAHRITDSHNITKKWSALMAHELKTPLTILKNRIEALSLDYELSPRRMEEIDEEMVRLESIIQDFLEWAVLESDTKAPEIYAVSVKKRSEYLIENLKKTYPEAAICSSFPQDHKIFCNPIHFDQLLSNLITNSLKYAGGDVAVEFAGETLSISDRGPGIPESVLANLGSPFNRAKTNAQEGFGLGLAWVNTICRKYGWTLNIENQNGNSVQITFPETTA